MFHLRLIVALLAAAAVFVPSATASRSACTIVGTSGADRLVGTHHHDVICGLGGPDRILGEGGDDVIRGGGGDDHIRGGRGDDVIRGNAGNDKIWGDRGRDVVSGGSGSDRLKGGPRPDTALGGPGNDVFYMRDDSRDTVNGGKGVDTATTDAADSTAGVERVQEPLPSGPEPPKIVGGPSGLTNATSATFGLSSDAPVSFECSIDGSAFAPCGSSGGGATATYSGLDDGRHVFKARAIDATGTSSAAASRTWTVDATPPRVTIETKPKDGTSTTVDFGYASSEPGEFECRLDGDSYEACGNGTSGSKRYSGLAPGLHTFAVTSTDAAGNRSNPATDSWTVTVPGGDPKIAAAGDIACDPANPSFNHGTGTSGSCRQKYVSDLLVGAGYDAVLPLGDNQYYCGGYDAWFGSYDPSWGRVMSITHPAVGNHEYLTHGGSDPSTGCDSSNAGADGYFRYFGSRAGERGKGYYSYDVGAWHLIALNSNCGDAGGCGSGSPQLRWLHDDLAASNARCTLAYWHVPLYSSGGRDETKTSTFWQELYDAGADVVLNGHDHIYERFAPQDAAGRTDDSRGIREFVVGTGGANHTSLVTTAPNSEVRNSQTFGVLQLTLHATSYDWKFIPEPGKSFTDSGSNSCH